MITNLPYVIEVTMSHLPLTRRLMKFVQQWVQLVLWWQIIESTKREWLSTQRNNWQKYEMFGLLNKKKIELMTTRPNMLVTLSDRILLVEAQMAIMNTMQQVCFHWFSKHNQLVYWTVQLKNSFTTKSETVTWHLQWSINDQSKQHVLVINEFLSAVNWSIHKLIITTTVDMHYTIDHDKSVPSWRWDVASKRIGSNSRRIRWIIYKT